MRGVNTLCRTGCLVLTLLAIANQSAYAEEAGTTPPAKPAEVPPPAPAPAEAAKTPADAPAKAVEVPPPADAPKTPAADAAPAKPVPATAASDPFFNGCPAHGYLRSRYRARWTDGASDQDLVETLSLDIGDPDSNRVTAHFLGDLAIDLDGSTDDRGHYTYDSARDSKGTNVVPQFYDAFLDVHRVGPLSYVRAGRQSIYETPEISFFDGMRAETEELGGNRVKLGAYAGVPVYLYQGHTAGDFLGGAYGEGRLWQGARARVDWQHLSGTNGEESFNNTLIGLGGWQRVGQYVDLHAHYTSLDYEARDVLVRGTFNQSDWDLRFQTSYYQLLQTQRNAVIEADVAYPILKEYQPYGEFRWMVSKGFGDFLNVDAGMDVRKLIYQDQESAFNHQYNRYFATVDVMNLLVKGSSISLTGERWASQETHTESQGLDITCPIATKNKVSAGTAHYLYKYDYYADEERVDVQVYYMKFEHKYSSALRFSVNYEFEDDRSSANYNELRGEVIWSF